MNYTTTLNPSEPAHPSVCAEVVGAHYSPSSIVAGSVSPATSTLSLHFEHVHFFHRIHHILQSLSSYNLTLELTRFKSTRSLSSVVVRLLGLFLMFTSLECLEIGLDHFDLRLGRLSLCLNRSRLIDFRLDWLMSGLGLTDQISAESAPTLFGFHLGWIIFHLNRLLVYLP